MAKLSRWRSPQPAGGLSHCWYGPPAARWTAALFVLACSLLPSAPAADGQTVGVSNHQGDGHVLYVPNGERALNANAFTTGGTNSDRYTLNNVKIHDVDCPSGVQLAVSVHADAGGYPDSSKIGGGNLSRSGSSGGTDTFTASGITLNGNTTYFVVVGTTGGRWCALYGHVDTGETGTPGWSIADSSMYNVSMAKGLNGPWDENHGNIRFSVGATVATPPGVWVGESVLSVPEGGSANYLVKLNTQPTHPVTITVAKSSGGDADLSVGTPASGSLTFTTANWNTAQTVTVQAAEDDDMSAGSATFAHTASSTDPDYGSSLSIDSVTATEEENDSPPAAPGNLQATPGNGEVTLAWGAVAGITGWEVSSDGGSTWTATGSTTTTHAVTGLSNGTEYTFKVRGVNAGTAGGAGPGQ